MRIAPPAVNHRSVAASYIVNFVLYVSSNDLATRKWHCAVSAVYSTQLFYSSLCFSCDIVFLSLDVD